MNHGRHYETLISTRDCKSIVWGTLCWCLLWCTGRFLRHVLALSVLKQIWLLHNQQIWTRHEWPSKFSRKNVCSWGLLLRLRIWGVCRCVDCRHRSHPHKYLETDTWAPSSISTSQRHKQPPSSIHFRWMISMKILAELLGSSAMSPVSVVWESFLRILFRVSTSCVHHVSRHGQIYDKTMIQLSSCPMHVRETSSIWPRPWTLNIKPDYAGVRTLNLDGYV